MALTFDPYEEFQQYLAGISFKHLLDDADFVAASKRLHKRMLALLVVELQFTEELKTKPTDISSSVAPYLEEFRSDLLSALMIFHVGLYKATLMSARSGIENFFRVVAGSQHLDYRGLKTVFELIELVKESPASQSSGVFNASLDLIVDRYSTYCNYVHSSGEDYLSLDRKLADLPRWDKESGIACADSLTKMIQAAICVLVILRPTALSKLRHDLKDAVLDALSMTTKARLSQEVSF